MNVRELAKKWEPEMRQYLVRKGFSTKTLRLKYLERNISALKRSLIKGGKK